KTYFDHVGSAYRALRTLPVEGIGLDFVHGREPNEQLVKEGGRLRDKTLFAGVVDGRNVWLNDLGGSLDLLDRLAGQAEDLVVSTSCSLLHVPVDLDQETELDEELRSWLAFARQKVREVATLASGIIEGREAIAAELEENREALERRRRSERARNPKVRERVNSLVAASAYRYGQYPHRRKAQSARLSLPLLPTTTIGSFPQTQEIRRARAKLQSGELGQEAYREAMREEIERVVRYQEEVGLDVLVHGEPERNDMVQYFAEQMDGFALTAGGWVQSYGSRCVRPPILFGDVDRGKPMTLEWFSYAQSLTDRPVKGMLTGPVTMLMWSFVRDDQPRSETCKQLALAIRDEVADLEKAGARTIQVDEPALREGLPLRAERRKEYLEWAVACFRLATAAVADETQIVTHMCYSDFGDIMDALEDLDADVALIEASRSGMELLEDFRRHAYEREIGPGVFDVHSPRVPSVEEMLENLRRAVKVLPPDQIWVNPDCGLKTRDWEEVGPSLRNMVEATRRLRKELGAQAGTRGSMRSEV
ncbi:MAG: 5-methyltetrahydropteroyltriglutamate--homocysteine S-methyltransferase, partial [Actinomycetota bacterium]